jgi:uncharacterized protein with GYD domain
MGVKVTGQYWALGPIDGLLVFDAPDEPTAAAAMLKLSSQGFVQTTTVRLFEAGEFGQVLAAMAK